MTRRPNRALLVVSFAILFFCVAVYAVAWLEMCRPERAIFSNWKLYEVGLMEISFRREEVLRGWKKPGESPPSFSGWSHNSFVVSRWIRFTPPTSSAYLWKCSQIEMYKVRLWPLAVLALIYPIRCSLMASRHRKRSRVNHCPGCDYDLRGNTSGVCPECGTPVGSAVNAPAR